MHECNNVTKAANHLRTLADELDCMANALKLPHEEYTLDQAMTKLRLVLGRSFQIEMQLSNTSNGKTNVEWSVWDGASFHKGRDLTSAVNACLKAHEPPPTEPENPVGDAQAVLDAAVASAF